ncbi:MAG: SRPBCC family protein [Gemmatimonadaceae bacterium]
MEGRRGPRRRRRSSRPWGAVSTAAAVTIRAPRERLVKLYLDYQHWSQLFPSIRGAKLVKEENDRIVLDVDHRTDGHVVNVMRQLSPYEIELDERKPQFSAEFINRFEPAGDHTRLVVTANVRLKGAYAILAPFLGLYVRRRIRRSVLEPMRAAIEASA